MLRTTSRSPPPSASARRDQSSSLSSGLTVYFIFIVGPTVGGDALVEPGAPDAHRQENFWSSCAALIVSS